MTRTTGHHDGAAVAVLIAAAAPVPGRTPALRHRRQPGPVELVNYDTIRGRS